MEKLVEANSFPNIEMDLDVGDSRPRKGRPYRVKVRAPPAHPYDDDISGVMAEVAVGAKSRAAPKP